MQRKEAETRKEKSAKTNRGLDVRASWTPEEFAAELTKLRAEVDLILESQRLSPRNLIQEMGIARADPPPPDTPIVIFDTKEVLQDAA